jgi:hypothetical protein
MKAGEVGRPMSAGPDQFDIPTIRTVQDNRQRTVLAIRIPQNTTPALTPLQALYSDWP